MSPLFTLWQGNCHQYYFGPFLLFYWWILLSFSATNCFVFLSKEWKWKRKWFFTCFSRTAPPLPSSQWRSLRIYWKGRFSHSPPALWALKATLTSQRSFKCKIFPLVLHASPSDLFVCRLSPDQTFVCRFVWASSEQSSVRLGLNSIIFGPKKSDFV